MLTFHTTKWVAAPSSMEDIRFVPNCGIVWFMLYPQNIRRLRGRETENKNRHSRFQATNRTWLCRRRFELSRSSGSSGLTGPKSEAFRRADGKKGGFLEATLQGSEPLFDSGGSEWSLGRLSLLLPILAQDSGCQHAASLVREKFQADPEFVVAAGRLTGWLAGWLAGGRRLWLAGKLPLLLLLQPRSLDPSRRRKNHSNGICQA